MPARVPGNSHLRIISFMHQDAALAVGRVISHDLSVQSRLNLARVVSYYIAGDISVGSGQLERIAGINSGVSKLSPVTKR